MAPLYVALDTPDLRAAVELAKAVRPHVGGLKVGLELFGAHGPDGVRRIAELGLPLFLDLKLHDIPNTVGKAVTVLAPLRPALLTVHASGGRAMMAAAKAAAGAETRVVGVTVLTSLDEGDLAEAGVEGSAEAQVGRLTKAAREAGLDGVVCSGWELAALKEDWAEGTFVVPGLRPPGSEAGDQTRTVTPRQALDDGASVLVVGRPITAAADPKAAARAIVTELSMPR